MTTIRECREADARRRSSPGPHDEADLLDYWIDEPTSPVPNKCWTNTDEDGDGKGYKFGPPADGTFGPQDLSDLEVRESPDDPSGAVSATDAVKD